jgi:hypothetical protein
MTQRARRLPQIPSVPLTVVERPQQDPAEDAETASPAPSDQTRARRGRRDEPWSWGRLDSAPDPRDRAPTASLLSSRRESSTSSTVDDSTHLTTNIGPNTRPDESNWRTDSELIAGATPRTRRHYGADLSPLERSGTTSASRGAFAALRGAGLNDHIPLCGGDGPPPTASSLPLWTAMTRTNQTCPCPTWPRSLPCADVRLACWGHESCSTRDVGHEERAQLPGSSRHDDIARPTRPARRATEREHIAAGTRNTRSSQGAAATTTSQRLARCASPQPIVRARAHRGGKTRGAPREQPARTISRRPARRASPALSDQMRPHRAQPARRGHEVLLYCIVVYL